MSAKSVQSVAKYGTLSFHENVQTKGHHVTSSLEQTYSHGGTTDVPLGEYLARPILISQFSWAANANFSEELRPWDLFVRNFDIKNRLQGFRFLRGHLKLRFVVTGNPFLFGRAIAAYEPLADRSVFTDYGPAFSKVSRMCFSQMPHIYLDASTSEGGEMTLPFFTPYNWIDLARAPAAAEMGILRMINMCPLQHALGNAGDVQISVYAWMDDAEISTPTANLYDSVVYQNALDGNDEHNSGLISKPATAVAKAAGWLKRFPAIKPYALATEIAADTVATIASFFGFSRPNVITNIVPYRELAAGELAVTNTHEVIPKLAMDGRNQLTVDSRTVGLSGEDEMNISSIVTRESYVDQGFWNTGNPTGHVILCMGVSPFVMGVNSSTTPHRNSLPPCAAVGHLFNYWRGSLIYRISVVAAAHHRGKILIQYDPLDSGVVSTNRVYSQVVDISETRDFEFAVNWHASTPWLRRHNLTFGTFGDVGYKEGSLYSIDPASQNGSLTISVLNPLGAPDESLAQSISVMIFVRGGDDMEFAEPADPVLPFSYRSSDPLVEPQNALDEPDDPVQPLADTTIHAMGNVSTPTRDPTSLVFFGETITSIRQFLRRYQYHSIVTAGAPGDIRPIAGVRLPVPTTGFRNREFILPWYAGWRGSHRFRLMPKQKDKVYMLAAAHDTTPRNARGFSAIQANVGPVEAEIPFYSNQRFACTRTGLGWTADTDTNPWSPNRQGVVPHNYGDTAITANHLYYASGEDFTLFFFVCIPPVFGN